MHLYLALVLALLAASSKGIVFATSTVSVSTVYDIQSSTTEGETTTAFETTTTFPPTTSSRSTSSDGTTTSSDGTSKESMTTVGETTIEHTGTTPADKTTTTTTEMMTSTADDEATSKDPDTTTADETTTAVTSEMITSTTVDETTSEDPDTTTADKITSTISDVPTTIDDQVTKSTENDVRNYIIIALSIALGIQSIGIISWCVWTRVHRSKKVEPSKEEVNQKSNLVSTATQTDSFFIPGFNDRPLPPISSHLDVVSEKYDKNSKPKFKHSLVHETKNVYDNNSPDGVFNVFPEKSPLVLVNGYGNMTNLPQVSINEDPFVSMKSVHNGPDLVSNKFKPNYAPFQTISDTVSSRYETSEDEVLDVDHKHVFITCKDEGESIDPDSISEHSKSTMTSVKEDATLITDGSNSERLEHSNDAHENKVKQSMFNASGLEEVYSIDSKSENAELNGMENKKPTFHFFQECMKDEAIEENISIEDEKNDILKRHVSFKEQTMFKEEHAPKEVNLKTKRKRSAKKKRILERREKYLASPYNVEQRYKEVHDTIANAYFAPELTQDKAFKKLFKLHGPRRRKQSALNKRTKTKVIGEEVCSEPVSDKEVNFHESDA